VLFFENKRLLWLFNHENWFFMTTLFLVDYINSISFDMMKTWICAPIQLEKRGIENLIKGKFLSYNRFTNIHYYQSLQYSFERIYYFDKENSFECSYLNSVEVNFISYKAINEMHLKFSVIPNLYDKFAIIAKQKKKDHSVLKQVLEFLTYSEDIDLIFHKDNSLENIEIFANVLSSYIKILTKGEVKKYTEILTIFEILINLENFLFSLKQNSNFLQLRNKSITFRRDFEKCFYRINSCVDMINEMILSKKIVSSFGENIKSRLKEYISEI